MSKILGVVIAMVLLSGCYTARATVMATPQERVTECKQLCDSLGMRMTAMVVIMNSSGCVCEVKDQPATPTTEAGASTASGGAIIAAAAAAQAAQQQQQQQMQAR